MTRHLADHRTPSQGARTREFLRIDHESAEHGAEGLFRRKAEEPRANRRAAEFCRIDRQDAE